MSVTGVTGARANLAADLPEFITRIRAHTDVPVAVGFGVSQVIARAWSIPLVCRMCTCLWLQVRACQSCLSSRWGHWFWVEGAGAVS